jgi:hypothetical protein
MDASGTDGVALGQFPEAPLTGFVIRRRNL